MSFIFLFLLSSEVILASPAKVDILTDRNAIVEQYCRVETGPHFDDCNAPRGKGLAVIYLSPAQGQLVANAVNAAITLGFAENLSKQDLFHGHLFLKGPQTTYSTPDLFLEDVTAVLYHSAEYNDRWRKEGQQGIPVESRSPRSFVGWPSGLVEKAIGLIQPGVKLKTYDQAGTIYTEELQESLPALSFHKLSSFGGYEPLTIVLGSRTCLARPVLNLFQTSGGRFLTAKGETFEIFFHCVFPL